LRSVKLSKNANPGYYCFLNAANLVDLVIPEGITTLYYQAFISARSLKHLKIPDSLTNIDSMAFAYCDNLFLDEVEYNPSINRNIPISTRTIPTSSQTTQKPTYQPTNSPSYACSCDDIISGSCDSGFYLLTSTGLSWCKLDGTCDITDPCKDYDYSLISTTQPSQVPTPVPSSSPSYLPTSEPTDSPTIVHHKPKQKHKQRSKGFYESKHYQWWQGAKQYVGYHYQTHSPTKASKNDNKN